MDGAAFVLMLSAMEVLAVMVSCHQVCFIGSEYNPQSGMPPRWFLPYKDPCECTAIRLGGMRIPASSYSQGAPYYLDELFLSADSDEIQAYFNCEPERNSAECTSPQPLGMENGIIPDGRITASSQFQNYCCPARKGRLNDNSKWASSRGDATPWIEVDLVEGTVVVGIITQGSGGTWYVNQYKVSYQKQPSSDFEHLTDGKGNIKVFIGNTDVNSQVTNLFDESVVATAVRIEPTQWYGGAATLRFELLGCHNE